MSTTSSAEIQELKDFIKNGFNQLDKKIGNVKSELKQEITEVRGDIKGIKGEINTIDARLKNVETAVQKIPEITEKFEELKNWRQIAFIIIAAIAGWVAKNGKF